MVSTRQLIETIKYHQSELDKNGPYIGLLRHGEKFLSEDVHQDIHQLLTEAGAVEAQLLGKSLSQIYHSGVSLKSSKVPRCMQTGSAIASGLSKPQVPEPWYCLAAEGVYVEDNNLVMSNFEKYSGDVVFAKLLSGESLPGFRDTNIGTAELLRDLLNEHDSLVSNPCFCITHDSILALFVGTLLDRVITHDDWFGYLEGVCLQKSADKKILLFWNHDVYDVTKKCDDLLQLLPSAPGLST